MQTPSTLLKQILRAFGAQDDDNRHAPLNMKKERRERRRRE
jgi:hypothetical protein